jgi:DNA primase
MIPRVFINDLLARTDIVGIVEKHITLKRRGANFYALCPFHEEKTPSFTVSSEKQFFYCFGCGVHGNAIDFLMSYSRLNFVDSIEELAALHSIDIPYSESQRQQDKHYQRRCMYQVMDSLNNFYQEALEQSCAKRAHDYLRNRGLSEEIISYFSLGFAPTDLGKILRLFGNYSDNHKLLYDSGIISNTTRGTIYARFQERIVFPIRDFRGHIIGFGGRVIGNHIPKYLNSPETAIFQKGRQLYGLYEAMQNHNPQYLIVVEGYMDVLALVQHGIYFAVASLGTSITSDHIQILFRNTSDIVCCYDGDLAGRKAAWRTLEISLPYMTDGRKIRFMFLPEGEDPDTIIRKEGKLGFEKRLKSAMPLSSLLFDTLLKMVSLSSREGKAQLGKLALPMISKIPQGTLRVFMRQELGNKLGILDDDRLELFMHSKVQKNQLLHPRKRTTMRTLIALLVQNPEIASIVPIATVNKTLNSDIAGLPLFMEIVSCCYKQPRLNTGQLLEIYRDTKFSTIIKRMSSWDHMISPKEVKSVFRDLLNNIWISEIEKRLEVLIAKDRSQLLDSHERNEFWELRKSLRKKTIFT